MPASLAMLDSSGSPWLVTVADDGALSVSQAASVAGAQVRTLQPNIYRLNEIVQDAYYLFQVVLPKNAWRLDVQGAALAASPVGYSNGYPSAFPLTSPNGTEYLVVASSTGAISAERDWQRSPAPNAFGQAQGQLDPTGTQYNLAPRNSFVPAQPNGQGNPVSDPQQRAGDKSGGVFTAGCSHIFPVYRLEWIPSALPPAGPASGPHGILEGAPALESGLALLAKCPLCGYVHHIFDPASTAGFIYISPRPLGSPVSA